MWTWSYPANMDIAFSAVCEEEVTNIYLRLLFYEWQWPGHHATSDWEQDELLKTLILKESLDYSAIL